MCIRDRIKISYVFRREIDVKPDVVWNRYALALNVIDVVLVVLVTDEFILPDK